MTLSVIAFFFIGLAVLVAGAELLVRGASRLAVAFGISPLVVGLTVVAFGTSSPELAVSVGSVVSGQTTLALGNVVGSNIFNVLFILGGCALIAPLVVSQQIVRLDVPIMISISILTALFALDGWIGRVEGAVLLAGAMAYTALLIRLSRREAREVQAEYATEFSASTQTFGGHLLNVVFVLVGLGLLVVGARWMVESAVTMGRALGVSDLVLGLTIVAVGTSMPEVATSIVASVRGERDIAVGNVVGSNIFNILAVLGASSLVSADGVPVQPAAMTVDLPVMIAVAVACLPICFTGYCIARWEGAVFLGYYVAYTLYIVLDATGHEARPAFAVAMVGFVLPFTALTLAVLSARAWRSTRRAAATWTNTP